MLEEALLALASAGGIAVAQAAGTEAWTATRERVARLLGRQADTLAELDCTEGAMRDAAPEEREDVRAAQATAWAARFRELLEALEGSDRVRTASALRELRPPAPYVTGSTFTRSQVQIGDGNRQDIRTGPDS
jgi:aminoglycoside phosphotransferase (APT) family kinase protein